jgi:hypothetical protein
MIKVFVFYFIVFSMASFVGPLFNTDVIQCKYLNNTNTNIYYNVNNSTNPILSVFYGCNKDEIKHYYVTEHIFNKNKYDQDFVIYKNYFGSTSNYYNSIFESFVIYFGIGPFVCSAINWIGNQIIQF